MCLKQLLNVLYVESTLKSFFFYLGFLSKTFTIHRTAGEGGGYPFNSSLPLPPSSQTLRHQPGDYCREIISTHSQQPDSSWKSLASARKLQTTKLRALKYYQTNVCKRLRTPLHTVPNWGSMDNAINQDSQALPTLGPSFWFSLKASETWPNVSRT